jgi:hypothetical protein
MARPSAMVSEWMKEKRSGWDSLWGTVSPSDWVSVLGSALVRPATLRCR